MEKGVPLKNMFNHDSLCEIALKIQSVYNSFQVDEFLKSTMDETWDDLELKAKSNGKTSRKIFQISEVSLKKNEKKFYTRKHSFADVSTRKHYAGTHSIMLIVNGAERGKLDFELEM